MKGTNLTHAQIIAIGSAIVFGLPLCAGLVAGHFFGFWLGVVAAGLVLLFIGYLAQRWVKRANKKERED
jgi:branched-subunit amino acid ABC-type transport system permease component